MRRVLYAAVPLVMHTRQCIALAVGKAAGAGEPADQRAIRQHILRCFKYFPQRLPSVAFWQGAGEGGK